MEIVTENPVTLAWMGDAVFTMRVRRHLLDKGVRKAAVLQEMSAAFNSAKGQAKLLELLTEDDILNEDELEIVRRGRNAHVKSMAKNADPKTYLKATAFEALLGYLYLYNHKDRLKKILDYCLKQEEKL